MSRVMKAVIFRHNEKPIGNFEATLKKSNVEYEIINAFLDEIPADFDPLKPDLLIVMGGAPGVYQADTYPFLKQELKILEKRLAADLPTLGVCLGCQLMAGALGGKNYYGAERGKPRELGWCKIKVNEAGMKTPVRHLDQSATLVIQSHVDTFELPKGATLLASSDIYENQAFSWGRNVLGLQCHPETDLNACKAWYVSNAGSVYKGEVDLADWRAKTEKYLPTMLQQSEKFLSEWLTLVRRETEKRCA